MQVLWAKSVFKAAVKQSEGKRELQLLSANAYPSSFALFSSEKGAARSEEEPRDKVWETADAAETFTPVSREEEGEKVTDGQETTADTVGLKLKHTSGAFCML